MKKAILKHSLKNALDFNGKANPKVVLGLVLREKPNLKKDVPKVLKEIEKTVKEIEKLSLEEIKKELQKIAPELLKERDEKGKESGKSSHSVRDVPSGTERKKEDKKTLKPLPNAKKGFLIVRIAPSPSGAMHIGHAYGASLNYEYAKMYNGKFIVRIEDTNPENIYPEAYKLIEDDTKWLTNNHVDKVLIQSSKLGTYYDYAEKLVNKEKAYVCTCNQDKWRDLKAKGKACQCRNQNKKENQLRYAKMFNEYTEGEAVLRLKTDIKHKNPAMRDFPIMRINEHIHPKTGKDQRVWPLMVFSVAIDDHDLAVTHVLNGKDHADNAKKETIIMEYLGWKPPEYKHWGRINFEGFKLSSSETRLAIEQGEYSGWGDIRLPFLPALRKRGYQPEAFRKFAVEIGLSLNDKKVSKEEFWKMVNAFNKEIVEKKANRYFFVDKPAEIVIEGAPKKEVSLDLHPNYPKRGKRKLSVKGKVYITEMDQKKLGTGKIHRLMDYCNFELSGSKWKFVSERYDDFKNAKNKGFIIHWLPADKLPKVEVVQEDNSVMSGFGEKDMLNLKVGDIVQLERRYFACLDNKEKNKLVFWYLHK